MALDPENGKARHNWLILQGRIKGSQSLAFSQSVSAVPDPRAMPTGELSANTSASQQVINVDFARPAGVPLYTVNFNPLADPQPAVARTMPSPKVPVPATPADAGARASGPVVPMRSQTTPSTIVSLLRNPDDLRVHRISLKPTHPASMGLDPGLTLGFARIEVSNGNGVGTMATRVTRQLRSLDVTVARITNADRFSYESTRIYVREGYAAEARLLSRMFPVQAEIVIFPARHLPEEIDVRVVIGRDLVTPSQVDLIHRVPPAPIARKSDLSIG
jgi:hypothetical protein